MAKCQFCNKRKGKRSCPALKGMVCTLCCGENRGGKIDCPEGCPYLHSHEAYQKERLAEQFLSQRRAQMREAYKKGGEKALVFLNLLDMLTYEEFYRHPDTPDSAILEGMETVRQELSPLTVPSRFTSKFGERLLKGVEDFLKETAYNKDLTVALIEGDMEFIKGFSVERAVNSSFLKGLVGFVETHLPEEAKRIRDQETPEKIIIPGVHSLSKGV